MNDLQVIAGVPQPAASPDVWKRPSQGDRYFWTNREDRVLEAHYEQGGAQACAPLLPGRTIGAIHQRARKRKLSAPEFKNIEFKQRWATSDQIDAVIIRTYQGEPRRNMVADCARLVGRPRWWVSKRAMKLGLVPPRFKEPDWTEAEINIISARAHTDPGNIVKQLKRAGFNRTATAIVVKLKRLGVARGAAADPDHYTATGLAKLMGVDAKGVTRWIEKGWLKANRRGTDRAAEQGGDQHWIHRKDVRAFIRDNAAAVDLRKVDKFWFIDLLAGQHQ